MGSFSQNPDSGRIMVTVKYPSPGVIFVDFADCCTVNVYSVDVQ